MYCQEHEFCPRVRSRYEHHRRYHHNNRGRADSIVNNNSQEPKKTAEVGIATQSDEQKPEPSRPKSSRICCHCKKPHPCGCSHKPHPQIEEQMRRCVMKWIQHIPVPADDSEADREKRTELAQRLADELVKNNNSDDVRNVIEQHLQLMPIWTPEDETIKKLFMNEIVEALLVYVQGLTHDEILRDDVITTLKDLPLRNGTVSDKVIENIIKTINNAKDGNRWNLKRDVENILRKLSFIADVDKDELISNIADNLLNNVFNKQQPVSHSEEKLFANRMLDSSNDSFTKLIQGFPKSLQELLSKDHYDDDELKATREQISKYLDLLLESIDVRLHTRTKNNLTDRFMNKIRKQDKRSSDVTNNEKLSVEDEEMMTNVVDKNKLDKLTKSSLKKRIINDVTDVLDSTDVTMRQSTLGVELTELLADQAVRGVRTSQAAREIHSMLISNDVPEEQAQYIAANLLNITKNMSRIDDNDSDYAKDANTESFSPQSDNIVNEGVTEQTEVQERKRSGDVESPTPSMDATHDDRNYETQRKLRRLSFQASSPQQNRRTSREQNDATFGNLSAIQDDETILSRKNDSKNEILASEQKYTKELHDVIESWINDLPVNLDVSGGQNYKQTLIHDLVGDIVDRNKYLALSKKAKSSDEEEIEHLRYQVFRWLNKLVDTHELAQIMPNTDQLMTQLRDITVPLFNQASGARTQNKREEGEIPHYSDALQDQISIWMDEVASNMLKSRNKLSQENLVKILANKIIQSEGGNVDDEIEEWLRDVVKRPDTVNIEKMKESLKLMLEEKGFTNKSHIAQQDTAEFIEENLSGAILEWLKARPGGALNRKEQLLQEQVATDLAQAMTRVFEHNDTEEDFDTSEHFMKEIKKHLKRLPFDAKNKGSDEFIFKKSKELLTYLQGLKMFQNATNRFEDKFNKITNEQTSKDVATIDENNNSEEESIEDTNKPEEISIKEQSLNKRIKKTADVLNDSIVKTCNEIKGNVSPETKQEIANRVISKVQDLNMNPDIFNDDALYTDLLTEEIDDVLKELQVDDRLTTFKRNVISKVNEARNKVIKATSGQTYKQNLKQVIDTSLPATNAMSSDERALFEIVKDDLVDAFVNNNYSSDNEQVRNKYKDNIDKKVTEFCNNYLKRFPATPMDRNKLNQDLFTALQSVPLPEADALRSEAQQARIKEQLRLMTSELPLEQTAEQKLRTNKIINVLAKNIHEIESHRPDLTETETDEIMKEEVKKWLKKLPMKDENFDLQEFTNRVVDKLRATEQSRQGAVTEQSTDEEWTDVSSTAQPAPTSLPSILTDQDITHLQKIRERTQQRHSISVSVAPPDAGSQTILEPPTSAAVDTTGLSVNMDQLLTARDSQTSEESKETVDQATEIPRASTEHRGMSADVDADEASVVKCRACGEWRGGACARGGAVCGGAGARRQLPSLPLCPPVRPRCPRCCGAPCPHPTYLYFR